MSRNAHDHLLQYYILTVLPKEDNGYRVLVKQKDMKKPEEGNTWKCKKQNI